MDRGVRGAAIVVSIASIGLLARAQGEPPVVLQWQAPPDQCPDAAYVEAEIARLLGGGGVSASDSKVAAKAKVVHPKEGIWRVDLTTSATPAGGGTPTAGSRSLEADSCRSLAEATALILALAVNPKRVAETAASVSASASASGSVSASASPSVSASAPLLASASLSASTSAPPPPPPPFEPLDLELGPRPAPPIPLGASFIVGGAADLGSFRVLAFGIGGAIEARIGRMRFDVTTVWLPKRRSTLGGSTPDAGGDFDLFSLGARIGGSILDRDDLEIAPTFAFAWSHVHASGVGVQIPADASIDLLAMGPGGYFAFALATPLFFRIQIDVLLPLRRPTFVLENIGDVHQVPWAIARALLGLELRL